VSGGHDCLTFFKPPRPVLYLAVGLGSALGAMARWGISVALQAPDTFPWGTLSVNVLGSLLIGFYAARVAPGRVWHHHGPGLRLFVMTGFCGGFTTFSMFGLETLLLVETGHLGLAATYVIGSLVLWMARRVGRLEAGHSGAVGCRQVIPRAHFLQPAVVRLNSKASRWP
jgi:fluoride exporter